MGIRTKLNPMGGNSSKEKYKLILFKSSSGVDVTSLGYTANIIPEAVEASCAETQSNTFLIVFNTSSTTKSMFMTNPNSSGLIKIADYSISDKIIFSPYFYHPQSSVYYYGNCAINSYIYWVAYYTNGNPSTVTQISSTYVSGGWKKLSLGGNRYGQGWAISNSGNLYYINNGATLLDSSGTWTDISGVYNDGYESGYFGLGIKGGNLYKITYNSVSQIGTGFKKVSGYTDPANNNMFRALALKSNGDLYYVGANGNLYTTGLNSQNYNSCLDVCGCVGQNAFAINSYNKLCEIGGISRDGYQPSISSNQEPSNAITLSEIGYGYYPLITTSDDKLYRNTNYTGRNTPYKIIGNVAAIYEA